MEKKISVTETFQQFSSEDWFDWIDDILNNNFAFPANRFSADGDPLIDVIDYLRRNSIGAKPYEEAVCQTVGYYQLKSKIPFLERLVNVMAYTKSPRYKKKLLELYLNRGLDGFRGAKDYLKSKLLLGLTNIDLEDEERDKVKDFINLSGFSVVDFDPAFIGHYLSFVREKYGPLLFETITQMCNEVPFEDRDENYRLKIVNVVMDVLDELHFYNNILFYHSLFDWLITSFHELNGRSMYKEIVGSLQKWFVFDKTIHKEISGKNSLPAITGSHILFLLDILTLDESVGEQPLEKLESFFEFLGQSSKLDAFRYIASNTQINNFFKSYFSICQGDLSYQFGSPRYYLYEEYKIKSKKIAIFLERLLLNSLSREKPQPFIFL